MRRVTVLGAGSWGTALAVHLGRVGHDVKLWARDPSLASDIEKRRANAVYLPDISLPESVTVTDGMAEALFETELIVSAIPSHGCRAVMRAAAPFVRPGRPLSAHEGARIGNAAADVGSDRRGVGTGPRLGRVVRPELRDEVAQQLPTAVLAASNDPRAIEMVQAEFRSPYFRLYGSADVVGVELVGALKNIIAIAAGVVEGLGWDTTRSRRDHTRARGDLRLAGAAGGRRETPSGFSGLGDLVLTWTAEPQPSRGD